VQLGGPDYAKSAPKITDSEGNVLEGASGRGPGYRYFGAAKNLPGVKELFEKEAPRLVRRTRFQMHKAITPDYYGFRDEEDGLLLRVEPDAERVIKAQVGRRGWGGSRTARRRPARPGSTGFKGAAAALGGEGAGSRGPPSIPQPPSNPLAEAEGVGGARGGA
jgi:pre-mRNA-splicing factor ISY1